MSDEKKDPPQPLPREIPVLVVDTVVDYTDPTHPRFAFTCHATCDRAYEVANALHQRRNPPPPQVIAENGRVPCKRMEGKGGPAMVNSNTYRDNYDGIFGKVPTGEA